MNSKLPSMIELTLTFQFDVYDWDSDGSHDLIGGFSTTVDELAASQHGKEVP